MNWVQVINEGFKDKINAIDSSNKVQHMFGCFSWNNSVKLIKKLDNKIYGKKFQLKNE